MPESSGEGQLSTSYLSLAVILVSPSNQHLQLMLCSVMIDFIGFLHRVTFSWITRQNQDPSLCFKNDLAHAAMIMYIIFNLILSGCVLPKIVSYFITMAPPSKILFLKTNALISGTELTQE